MTTERRQFLQNMIGTISAMAMPISLKASDGAKDDSPPDWQMKYEQTLLASSDQELFGIPKSWSCVRRGLHPFSPERTLILQRRSHQGDREIRLAQQIGRRCDETVASKDTETILRIVQAASVLTQVYGVPERTVDWAGRLLAWLFDCYSNVAQNHHWLAPLSWQGYDQNVKTSNGIVDWWLILIPQGFEFNSLDGTRVHALITPVFTKPWNPRCPVNFWYFMAKAIGNSFDEPQPIDSTWIDISRLDRKSACLSINRRIARNLTTIT